MQIDKASPLSSRQLDADPSSAKTGTLDYSAFLQLLVAQLKNQDPTKPMDTAQYMGQLASFSNVEQFIKVNSKLDSLIKAQALSQSDSLIGRTITSLDNSISGKIAGLRILETGTVALLENGQELELGPGITVTG